MGGPETCPLLAGAEIDDRREQPAHARLDADVVVAVECLDAERVQRGLSAEDRRLRSQPGDEDRSGEARNLDLIGAWGPIDDDRVGLSVAGAAGCAQVDVDRANLGGGEVVDRERVGATEKAHVYRLDAA